MGSGSNKFKDKGSIGPAEAGPGDALCLRGLGLLTDFRQCRRRRNGFGIDQAVQNGRLFAGQRAFEGRGELPGGFDPLAMSAEGLRIGGEIGILQGGGR